MGFEKLRLGHIILLPRLRIEMMASAEPAAEVICPVKGFVELTKGIFPVNSLSIARPSERSLLSVPVPCALI